MSRGKSGHKENSAGKRKRSIYKLEGRLLTNRIRRLKSRIHAHPNGVCAAEALKRIRAVRTNKEETD